MPDPERTELLAAALVGYLQTRARVAERIAEIQKQLAQEKPSAAPGRRKTAKPRLSPEGRARIVEATRKRWAAYRAAKKRQG